MSGPSGGRVALVVRVVGDPDRLDDGVLRTFAEMARTAETVPGYAHGRMVLADRGTGTVLGIFVFESYELPAAAVPGRTRTATEVAAVLIGGNPDAAVVEWFEVVDSAFEAPAAAD